MPDLVEKFFKEGLTEAEEQALSDDLWASEDTAEKFADAAREAYLRYGFPEPQVPPTAPGGGGLRGGWRLWSWALWGGLALGAAWLWHGPTGHHLMALGRQWISRVFTAAPHPGLAPETSAFLNSPKPPSSGLAGHSSPALPSGGEGPVTESGAAPPAAGENNPAGPSSAGASPAQRVPSEGEIMEEKAEGPKGVAGGELSPHAPGPSFPQPLNLDQNPGADYSSLSVFVHLTSPSPLAVRVLDTRGVQVFLLYAGSLGPGHWVFDWDGRLANEQPAQPGFYVIEVKSGYYSQRKTVQIH